MVTWSSVDEGAGVVGVFRMRKPTTDTAATITRATITRATIFPRPRPPSAGATGVTGDSPADMPTPLPHDCFRYFGHAINTQAQKEVAEHSDCDPVPSARCVELEA